MTTESKAYRLHYSCDYTGRYRRKTKRQIKWRFGFTNLTAVREGKRGSECRGEEHEVVLIWSVKSGKTRVIWNKSNISHLFHERNLYEKVEFHWESRSGEKFEIAAHADKIPGRPQYDFLVAGVSFFALPHVSELGGRYEDVVSEHNSDGPVRTSSRCSSVHHEVMRSDSIDFDHPPDDLGFRLSMAGFASGVTEMGVEVEDELTSDLFTTTLETLRERVTASIPEAEEMVSRAIINAFSDDRDSQTSFDSSSCDSEPQHPLQIEVEILRETFDWLNLNVAYAPRPDVEDQKLSYLQKQVDSMFVHVKHERLAADSAARILMSVATVLGMKLKVPVPKDTIILNEIDKQLDSEALIDSLCNYGDVYSAAVSKGRGFGICRYYEESGPMRAMAAAAEENFSIGASKPIVSILCTVSRPDIGRRSISEPIRVSKPSIVTRPRSHQRNTLTIDAVLQSSEELMAHTQIPTSLQPAVITPEIAGGFLRPNVFENIPARSPSSIFDSMASSSESNLVSPDYARYSPTSMIVLE